MARLTEKALQAAVVEAARLLGWRHFHPFNSRRSVFGWPDLVLVHTGQRRILYRELKTDVGRPTPAQREWLKALSDAGADAGIWRCRDWADGTIEKDLKGP